MCGASKPLFSPEHREKLSIAQQQTWTPARRARQAELMRNRVRLKKYTDGSTATQRYAASHPLERQEYNRAWCKANAERVSVLSRVSYIKRVYGLGPAEFAALLLAQGGVCAICGTANWGGRKGNPAVDHDHETGEVRGLLCLNCNSAIGHLEDSVELILKAASYLQAFAKNVKK